MSDTVSWGLGMVLTKSVDLGDEPLRNPKSVSATMVKLQTTVDPQNQEHPLSSQNLSQLLKLLNKHHNPSDAVCFSLFVNGVRRRGALRQSLSLSLDTADAVSGLWN